MRRRSRIRHDGVQDRSHRGGAELTGDDGNSRARKEEACAELRRIKAQFRPADDYIAEGQGVLLDYGKALAKLKAAGAPIDDLRLVWRKYGSPTSFTNVVLKGEFQEKLEAAIKVACD